MGAKTRHLKLLKKLLLLFNSFHYRTHYEPLHYAAMSRNHKLYNYIKDKIEDKSPKTDSKEKDDNKPSYYCEDQHFLPHHGAVRNRKLEQNENISGSQTGTPYSGKEEEYWNCNPRHLVMPVSFAIRHNSFCNKSIKWPNASFLRWKTSRFSQIQFEILEVLHIS